LGGRSPPPAGAQRINRAPISAAAGGSQRGHHTITDVGGPARKRESTSSNAGKNHQENKQATRGSKQNKKRASSWSRQQGEADQGKKCATRTLRKSGASCGPGFCRNSVPGGPNTTPSVGFIQPCCMEITQEPEGHRADKRTKRDRRKRGPFSQARVMRAARRKPRYPRSKSSALRQRNQVRPRKKGSETAESLV